MADSNPIKLSRELSRQLLLSNPEFVQPGLWKLAGSAVQVEIESVARQQNLDGDEPAVCEAIEQHSVWLALDSEVELPPAEIGFRVTLDQELQFFAPPEQLQLHSLAISLVVPAEVETSQPLEVYVPGPAQLLADKAAAAGFTVSSQPQAGVPLVFAAKEVSQRWLLTSAARCKLVGHEHPLLAVADPQRPGQAIVLCPVCNTPTDRWYDCATHGLHCGSHQHTCPSCHQSSCQLCSKDTCRFCEALLCNHCAEFTCAVCGGQACEQHRQTCSECQHQYCLACSGGTCSLDGSNLCKNCAGTCSSCGKVVRERLLSKCYQCGKFICPDCRGVCHLDGRPLCPGHQAICGQCGATLCDKHRGFCACCGRTHCKGHVQPCRLCARAVCADCLDQGICKQCRTLLPLTAEQQLLLPKFEALLAARPYRQLADLKVCQSPTGWLFCGKCGSRECRLGVNSELTEIVWEHQRSWWQRLLGR